MNQSDKPETAAAKLAGEIARLASNYALDCFAEDSFENQMRRIVESKLTEMPRLPMSRNELERLASNCSECFHGPATGIKNTLKGIIIDAFLPHLSSEPSQPERDNGELCQCCGDRYETVYRVPNEVWKQIAPDPFPGDDPSHYGGLLCPECADSKAREAGVELYWEAFVGDWHSCEPTSELPPEIAEFPEVDNTYAGDAWVDCDCDVAIEIWDGLTKQQQDGVMKFAQHFQNIGFQLGRAAGDAEIERLSTFANNDEKNIRALERAIIDDKEQIESLQQQLASVTEERDRLKRHVKELESICKATLQDLSDAKSYVVRQSQPAQPQPIQTIAGVDALPLAIKFHEIYEKLAPQFGYETREETREFDPETPNGKLMVAVCQEILAPPAPSPEQEGMPVCQCGEKMATQNGNFAGYNNGWLCLCPKFCRGYFGKTEALAIEAARSAGKGEKKA